MNRCCVIIAVITVVAASNLSAETEYVIVNDNSAPANAISIFTLNEATGTLREVTTLNTGGGGLSTDTFGNVADVEQAITPSASCIFAVDAFTSDIAAFSADTNYTLVGNYSDATLDTNLNGGSLVLSPNGKFLYASYSASGNIAAWVVNADCSLSLLATYFPKGGTALGPMKITPSGEGMIADVSAGGVSGAESFQVDKATGLLSDLGFLSLACSTTCTGPAGIDITKDSKVAIFASNIANSFSDQPFAITARITPKGLVSARAWSLPHIGDLSNNFVVFLSAEAYTGSGKLYFGASDSAAGVITTQFTENPLSISVTNFTFISQYVMDGAIGVTGNLMVIAIWPNELGVFAINQDGSLTQLSTTTVNQKNAGIFSLSIFPVTR